MKIRNILEKIDSLISSYLGIKEPTIKPNSVELVNNDLLVTNTESFERYLFKNKLNALELKNASTEDREKLGLAAGKAIAENLIITFENAKIRKL
jgi:hypothetical protein